MKPLDGMRSHRTRSFFVLGLKDDKQISVAATAVAPVPINASSLDDPSHAKKGIFLDIDEPYTLQLIQKAFAHPSRARRFHLTLGSGQGMDPVKLPAGCDFQWAEYERIDWDAVLAGKHAASSYCIRKGISRKAQLAHYTHRHVCKNPASILRDALPKTVVLDTWAVWEENGSGVAVKEGLADIVMSMGSSRDNVNRRTILDQCLAEAKQKMEEAERAFEENADGNTAAPVWILKGSTTNKGAGIFIVHLYEQVVDICWSESDIREWVLQRYIAAPLLLNRRKFHIRAYAVAVSAIRVYLAQDCLALCAGTRYRKNETANLFAHITNTAYQDLDPNFREDKCVLLWDKEDIVPVLVRDGTCNSAAEADQRVQQVIRDMEAITGELFRAYQTEFGVFSPIDGCFEQFGLDFMVDKNWQVYLLEVNPGPDFKQTGSRLQSVIENLMGSTIDAALVDNAPSHSQDAMVGTLKLVYENRVHGSDGSRGGKGINIKLS
jgi:tubulin--tyrosine ligase